MVGVLNRIKGKCALFSSILSKQTVIQLRKNMYYKRTRLHAFRKVVLLLMAATFCSSVAFSRKITDEQCANVVKAFGSMDLFMLLATQNDKMIDDILKEFGAPETSQQSALERALRQQFDWYKLKRSSLSRAHPLSGHSKMQIRELCGPPQQ